MWLLLKIEKAFGGLELASAFERVGGGKERERENVCVAVCGMRV